MGRFISIIFILSFLSPVFAGDKSQQEDVPVFTNKDLKKYENGSEEGSGIHDQTRKESSPPVIERPLDAGTILKENDGAIVVIAAYNKESSSFGHGSGFIATKDGTIVTSYHVISNAAYLKVKAGGRVLNVEGFLFTDRENDIAIIKAEGKNFQTVKIGDSDKVEMGEKVYVMGSPEAAENKISEGTFSGIKDFGTKRRMLQITAAFSQGSSGGPVFNEYGEVIGIATFIISGSRNLNFAVPINLIKDNISYKEVAPFDVLSEDYKSSADYWLNLGNDLNRKGKYIDAVDAYRKAIKINPDLTSAHNGLGVAYMKLKRYKESVDVLKEALRLEPDSALLHSNLGLVYTERGMYNEAVDELKQAISILPDLSEAHFNLGNAYRRLRMYGDAIEAYRQAVRIDPDFGDAHFGLGLSYSDLNNKDAAMEEYKILKSLDSVLAQKLFNIISSR